MNPDELELELEELLLLAPPLCPEPPLPEPEELDDDVVPLADPPTLPLTAVTVAAIGALSVVPVSARVAASTFPVAVVTWACAVAMLALSVVAFARVRLALAAVRFALAASSWA
jgi:hypothetical protein